MSTNPNKIFYTISVISIALTASWIIAFFEGRAGGLTYRTFIVAARLGFCAYLATMIVLKVSVACFIWRTFGPFRPRHRTVVVFFTAIPLLIGLVLIIFTAATCSYNYTDFHQTYCPTSHFFNIFNQVFSLSSGISNWYFTAQAFYILWKMTMTRTARISAMVVFAIGAAGDGASVMRVVSFYIGANDTDRKINFTLWSIIEGGALSTAACLFTLRPLFSNANSRHVGDDAYFMPDAPPRSRVNSVVEQGNTAMGQTDVVPGSPRNVMKPRATTMFTSFAFTYPGRLEADKDNELHDMRTTT